MGTWDWVYFFPVESRVLNAEAVFESVIGVEDWFSYFDGPARGAEKLEDSDGEVEYLSALDLGSEPTDGVRRLVNGGGHFQVRCVGPQFPFEVAFAVDEGPIAIRPHVAVGWLARAQRRLDADGQRRFISFLVEIMQAAGAGLAIGVSEPSDTFAHRLLQIDGAEVFDNRDWRGKPYDLQFLLVDNNVGGSAPVDGIELAERTELQNGIIEYRVHPLTD